MSIHRKLTTVAAVAALAFGLAACGGGGSDTSDAPPAVEAPDLSPAQMAAAAAASAAAAAVAAQADNQAADAASYAVAQNAAARAAAASQAAASATTLEAAQAAAAEAEVERANAVKYANMVMAAHVEANALAAAMMAADTAATAAEDAATAAEAAAATVTSLTGEGTDQAEAANAAAMTARAAADAARTASDAAQGAETSGDAEMYQATAESEQGKAEYQQAKADELQRESQVAHDTSAGQNEMRDIADARDAAKDAADSVAAHLTAVQGKAADAHDQAVAARAAADRAKSARRDYANADKYATMAETEARTAQAALTAAMGANSDAQAALAAANAADTSDEAEAQQALAEAADVIALEAHTGTTGAGMAYMAASDAAAKAAEASGVNVLAILSALNAEEITAAAAKRMQLAALNTHLAAMAADDDNANAALDVGDAASRVIWRYHGDLGGDNAVGGDAANADSEPGEGELEIVIEPTGGQEAELTRDNPMTAGDDETNFVKGSGLGDFAEYHITGEATEDGDRTLTIVFTDKEQARGPIAASTANFQNAVPVASRLSDFTGTTANYDHDGDSRTPAIAVTVSCQDGVTCNAPEDSRGNVISVTGYRISTADVGVPVEAVPEDEDDTYLAFGMWLAVDGEDAETFGAFDFGGAATTATTAVTGTATYNGKAAGVHNMPSATNFFHADATLNANFGNATAEGSVTGRIHNIMSGGTAIGDDIRLVRNVDADGNAVSNITAAGAFNGTANMGAGVTNPQTSVVSYPFNGVWSGQFYNAAPGSAPAGTAPMSAAGTFGVTHTDMMGTPTDTTDDQTSSFVGAFGAHRN